MTNASQSSFALCRLPACVALLLLVAGAPLAAQAGATIGAAEFHKEPGGTLLGRTTAASSMPVLASRSGWRQVRVRGWVASSLLKRDQRDGFDVVVTADDVRLRASPAGKELGRLEEGMLLSRLGSRGDWTQVERKVWVPSRAVSETRVASVPAGEKQTQAYQVPASGGPVSTSSAPARDSAASDARRMSAARRTALAVSPGGAAVGTLDAGAPMRVLSEAGGWSRVQLEGWVRDGDLVPGDSTAQGVTAAEVRANPQRYVGQELEWQVQYISTASADELRPEMPPGQPYMLARGPLPEPGFVYVMLSRADSARVASLPALADLTIRARVRAARSRFLSTPVVELVSILSTGTPP
jgi:hypothetical protein